MSKPLTEMAAKPGAKASDPDNARAITPHKPLPGDRIDDIVAGNPGPPVIPDPTAPPPESADMPTATSFEGIFNRNSVYPPDPDGDVGPNHYVQMVNLSIQIFDKAGTSLYGPENSNVIWNGFGGDCATTNDGDPIVLYDQFADRWLVSQFSVGGVGLHECVAVSTSPDPTGSWYRYQFSYDDFPDYPKFGVWPDGYYVTYNMFDENTFDFLGTKVCAMNRAAMLAGSAAAQQCFDLATEWSLLPSDADGSTPPPAGSPNYMVGEHWSDQSKLTMYKFSVNWTTPANTTLTGPVQIPVNAFTWACVSVYRGMCVPQNTAITPQKLESLGGRMMYRLAYRNFGTHESLVTNHSVAMDGNIGQTSQLGIGWYELRAPNAASPTVYQQGTTADPNGTTFRWMGSMAQDKQGNMALGYSASSSTTLPSIRYNGRLVDDPLNQLPQAEGIIFSGTGAQTGSAGRWGDYSSMHTDPLDDCTFWYTNEYVQTTGTAPWRTRIGQFKYPGCTGTATVPSAPTLAAVRGNQTVTVNITAPTNGGNPINEYVVTATPGGQTCTTRPGVDANPLQCSFTGLTNGTAYTFSGKARNAVGQSAAGTVIATPATVPGAPTGVSGLPDNAQVAVSWTAPASNGGASITEYTATSTPGSKTCVVAAPATTCTVTGLTNGTAYTFKLKAKNAVGYGTESLASGSVTPRTVPGAPTGVSGLPGNAQVPVSWTAPASNGGASITEYTATSTPGSKTCVVAAPATTCTVTGLTNGTAYTFKVKAKNAAGYGTESAASGSVTPRTVPGAPTGVSGVPGNAQVTVSWTAPASNGGASITEYTATSTPGSKTCVVAAPATTCTVTGLTNATAYTFKVKAKNAAGYGTESAASGSVTPNAGPVVPGAPTEVSGVPGNAQVAVSWTAPASNGGAAITEYVATASPDGATCTSNGSPPATSCTVTGLTNGRAYTFTVKAKNSVGFGPDSSASAQVTPRTVPGAPAAPSGTAGNGEVAVSWVAPASDGGSPITKYHVIASPGGATCESGTTSCTVKGLTNGQAYTFKVRAENEVGPGEHSADSAPVTPFGPPAAPSNVTVVPGDQEAMVSWNAPTDTGGLPIVKYVVTANPGGLTCETTTTSCTVKGLTNGQSYTFTVVAVTAGGSGGAAAGPSATPQAMQQTAVVNVPKKIKYNGKTVVLSKAVVTNAGQKATAKVKVKPKSSKYSKVRITKRGKVVIRTFGQKKLTVTLTLSAPATASYTSYSYTKKWTVKKK